MQREENVETVGTVETVEIVETVERVGTVETVETEELEENVEVEYEINNDHSYEAEATAMDYEAPPNLKSSEEFITMSTDYVNPQREIKSESQYQQIVQDRFCYIRRPDPNVRYCPGCHMDVRRSVFYHHARTIREHGTCKVFTIPRFPCPMCDDKMGTLENLCDHLQQIHGAPTNVKTSIFSSEIEFQAFRLELEGRGGNFRMARGTKNNRRGPVQYYRCNRIQAGTKNSDFNGHKITKRSGELLEKPYVTKQRVRTEEVCTAFFQKLFLPDGKIEVRYCDYHLHDDERLRLPEPVRRRILDLAKKDLPFPVILLIIKAEIEQYAQNDSANWRRIDDMSVADIRVVVSAAQRHQRTVSRAQQHVQEEDFPEPESAPVKTRREKMIRVDQLSEVEKKCLETFNKDRGAILDGIRQRETRDYQKRVLYETLCERVVFLQKYFKSFDEKTLELNDEPDFNAMYAQLCALLATFKPARKMFSERKLAVVTYDEDDFGDIA
ncbi:unnamed protein product [Caenorhabditis auriculariae]|uniref:C2H2-type domain-containing protein n=1 Tax=Caenorhabditis auriculariae TaxID=2777116 RepID=A0A8S1H7B9_9PELO|nr:unnamed protein product [Caenorhabditis auriculariae]